MDYGLEYNGDPSVLEGYTDASWITDQEDYASMSGWIFTLGAGSGFRCAIFKIILILELVVICWKLACTVTPLSPSLRCFELVGYQLGFKKGNGSQSSANNAASNDINTDHNKGVPHTLTNDQYQRLMNLLSDTDSGASQHITFCSDHLFDIMDVTELNLTVSHPNGTVEQDLTQKFLMGTGSERGGLYFFDEENGINDLNFFNEYNSSLRSNDPYDDGGDSADSSSKTAPKSSIDSPADSIVDYIAKDHEMHTDNPGSADLSGSSSSRKVTKDSQYATETYVSKGIKDKVVNYSELSIENFVFTTSLNKIHEPSTYVEAIKDNRWVDAMNQEIEALNRNHT
ncbi:hypothetical protein Tco_1228056 [Tanacetum coccineum]